MQLVFGVLCSITLLLLYKNRYTILFNTLKLYNKFNITDNQLSIKLISKNDNEYTYNINLYGETKILKTINTEIDLPLLEKKLYNYNLILYMSITTSDNQIIDITENIKEFVYHYDTDLPFSHFLQYVSILNGTLTIYLNNTNLDEYIYNISDIINNDKSFKDLLYI
jgi:hypothetical protein